MRRQDSNGGGAAMTAEALGDIERLVRAALDSGLHENAICLAVQRAIDEWYEDRHLAACKAEDES